MCLKKPVPIPSSTPMWRHSIRTVSSMGEASVMPRIAPVMARGRLPRLVLITSGRVGFRAHVNAGLVQPDHTAGMGFVVGPCCACNFLGLPPSNKSCTNACRRAVRDADFGGWKKGSRFRLIQQLFVKGNLMSLIWCV